MQIEGSSHKELFEAAHIQFEKEYEELMELHPNKWVGHMGVYRIGISEDARLGKGELINLCKDVGIDPTKVIYRCLELGALGPDFIGPSYQD